MLQKNAFGQKQFWTRAWNSKNFLAKSILLKHYENNEYNRFLTPDQPGGKQIYHYIRETKSLLSYKPTVVYSFVALEWNYSLSAAIKNCVS